MLGMAAARVKRGAGERRIRTAQDKMGQGTFC
jgi:hypothetical protein